MALPTSFVDAAALLPASRAVRQDAAAGTVTAAGRGGLPQGPDAPPPGFFAGLPTPAAAGDEAVRRADEALRLAEADLRQGYHRRAIEALQAALPAAEAADDRVRLAALVGALRAAHHAAGMPGLARPALARSLELAHAGGDAAPEAVSRINAGNALAAVRAGEERVPAEEAAAALGAYEGAAGLALATDRPELAARAQINAARLLARRGDTGAAAERARLAPAQLERAPADDPERPIELVAAGLALGEAGARHEAAAVPDRAAALAEARGDERAQSYALGPPRRAPRR